MDIWIGFAVAALKAGVSGAVGNEIVQVLADQGIDIGSDKFNQYLEKTQKELSQVLTDKSLIEMNVPKDYIAYVQAEIKELLRSVSLEEDLFRNCRYDAKSLAEALYKKYEEQKKDFIEYKSEIQKVLYVMSEKAISLEKERDGFTVDSLVHIMKNEDDQMELLRKILHTLDEFMKKGMTNSEKETKPERKRRLPDRTEEYRRKWTENMFLNDFDEDDAEAGVNIPLCKLHQPSFYRLKGQNKDLANLEERLDKCTQGKDTKNRMLLILGQPGMGKSTMITWFVDWYKKRIDEDKKEILVYRFTDFDIDWSFNINEKEKREINVDSVILERLNMKKEDLHKKILILDGFDEVAAGNNRMAILNRLYNAWAKENSIKDFSLLVTCRENYVENLSQLLFPYITLQPWNESQIASFCRNYGELAKLQVPKESIGRLKQMKNIFGIPIILYMALALEITVSDESSVVEVYDQIFSLDGGIYDRCLKRDASIRWDDVHRIAEIKEQIHHFSREISVWMFENSPQQATIPQKEYEKIWDKIFEGDNGVGKSQKKDVLIGNYFRMIHCYDGVDTEQLTFVHRSIYEYFVAETICSEISEEVGMMTEEAQEKVAEVLGYRLKEGRIDYTIGQYLKAKVGSLIAAYSKEKKNQFVSWLEGAVEKMLDAGMLYYSEKNIKEYRNIIEKEMKCFLNLIEVLRVFVDFSNQEYFLQIVNKEQLSLYIKYLTDFINEGAGIKIDFSKIDLKGANLKGVDLSFSNLNKAYLREANLRRADLKGANLSSADLSRSDLSRADLSHAYLNGADLRGTNISEADLSIANIVLADLRGADLGRANLSQADLRGADLRGADLTESDLRGADLNVAKLRGAKLIDANLSQADLEGVDLKEVALECSIWSEKDIEEYIDMIKQAEFDTIFSCSETTGEKRLITHRELLIWYPD